MQPALSGEGAGKEGFTSSGGGDLDDVIFALVDHFSYGLSKFHKSRNEKLEDLPYSFCMIS